ncbi:MAG: hypothetical protein NXI15_17580 [Gammaproteobacteria bacterium]|nr:hypothetical protein [Gammaproteobacteria bacterium]
MIDPRSPKSGELSALFDDKRREVTGETLEWIRHNYYIAASMSGDDSPSIGGLQINPNGRMENSSTAKKKEEKTRTDLMIMAILDRQLQEIELAMARKYGEDFAEQFAAELLDEKTFEKLMQIVDPEERRKAIALSIYEGIRDGSIDADTAHQNPDFKEWLDKHAELRDHRQSLDHSGALPEDRTEAENSHDNADRPDLESGFGAIFEKQDFPVG